MFGKKKERVESAEVRDAVIEAKGVEVKREPGLSKEQLEKIEHLKKLFVELEEFEGVYSFGDFAQLSASMKEVELFTLLFGVFVELRRVRRVLESIEKAQYAG